MLPSIEHATTTLFLGYKFPVALAVLRVEPHLSPPLQDPVAVVPIPIATVLPSMKVIFIIVNKSHKYIFFSFTRQMSCECPKCDYYGDSDFLSVSSKPVTPSYRNQGLPHPSNNTILAGLLPEQGSSPLSG